MKSRGAVVLLLWYLLQQNSRQVVHRCFIHWFCRQIICTVYSRLLGHLYKFM